VYDYITWVRIVDFPGAAGTSVRGYGAAFVGFYFDAKGATHGYILDNSGPIILDVKGAYFPTDLTVSNAAFGTNQTGATVGIFTTKDKKGKQTTHGFLWQYGTFTQIDVPGSTGTTIQGINMKSDIAGKFDDAAGSTHGFIWAAGSAAPTTIDYPLDTKTISPLTKIHGINDAGDIAGEYNDLAGNTHGFVRRAGIYETIDYPNSIGTVATAVNMNGGIIVGTFTDQYSNTHGFISGLT
jgi:uncharacterized membrane protein